MKRITKTLKKKIPLYINLIVITSILLSIYPMPHLFQKIYYTDTYLHTGAWNEYHRLEKEENPELENYMKEAYD